MPKHLTFEVPVKNIRRSADRVWHDLNRHFSPQGQAAWAAMSREDLLARRERVVHQLDEMICQIGSLQHPPRDLLERATRFEQLREQLSSIVI